MNLVKICLGVIAFAVATAILYAWGLRKSMTQKAELEQILLRKVAANVVKYLKKHGEIDMPGIVRLCQGAKSSQFWSRKHLVVQNAEAFAPTVAEYLKSQRLVEELPGRRFCLKISDGRG